MIQEEMNLNRGAIEGRKTGQECIWNEQGKTVSTIKEYWQWAYSSLLCNTERGHFAEYLIALALGIADTTRIEWDNYDLKAPNGITIEVKTSGYLQNWGQKELTNLRFTIAPTKAWNYETNKRENTPKRQADVYIFCVNNYTRKDEGINPLDMSQWEFYVLPTKILDEKIPDQQSISLNKIKSLGAISASFSELKDVIEHCLE